MTAISNEGSGVAHHEGMAVFIPLTAPGDRLLARVVKVHSRHAFAILEALTEPSAQRMENDCPVFSRCGGCALRHIGYAHELEAKEGWLRDNLRRIGGIDIALDPAIPSPACARYRNKAQFPIRSLGGRPRAGFFSPRSHRLVPIDDCKLQPAFFRDITAAFLDWMEAFSVPAYDEAAHTGLVRHLYLRHGEASGEVMVCPVVNGQSVPHADALVSRLREACPQVSSVVLGHNTRRTNVILGERVSVLYGADTITDNLCGVRLRLSPHAFYQVNRPAAELLYRAALAYASPEPDDVLLDLYCGAGTIGLSMAHAVKALIGVELVPAAVADARRAARENGYGGARFICADAAQAADTLSAQGVQPDIVVLDPPRKGADLALLGTIARIAPRKLVYISCDTATFARDCKILAQHGYALKKARAADLFPRTAHVETVALLLRVKGTEKAGCQ